MRTLTRWNPFREMTRFDPFGELGYLWKDLPVAAPMGEAEPMMRVEVTENDTGYLVKAEVPGVAKDDIEVSVDGNVVTVSAEVKREKEAKEGEKVLRTERYYGAVTRAFTLPMDVDFAKAEAKIDNGVLMLTLPKAPGGAARQPHGSCSAAGCSVCSSSRARSCRSPLSRGSSTRARRWSRAWTASAARSWARP